MTPEKEAEIHEIFSWWHLLQRVNLWPQIFRVGVVYACQIGQVFQVIHFWWDGYTFRRFDANPADSKLSKQPLDAH